MKKNSRLKSFFAILLAVSMIFQQSSLNVLATDDTYVEDATQHRLRLKTKQNIRNRGSGTGC